MPLNVGVFHCAGDEGKRNWLLVRRVPPVDAQRCVVFFPGDISDFAVGAPADCYSLEALLWVLCCKYPNDTVILVKPRMMVDFHSIYVNFMFVDGMGNPRPLAELQGRAVGLSQSCSNQDTIAGDVAENVVIDKVPDEVVVEPALVPPRAVTHLQALLRSLEGELGESLPEKIALVGFSKGAAVLNALLRESNESAFWNRCQSVHFVDAGLQVPGVFSVQEPELQVLSNNTGAGFTIWLHSTPRQMQDPLRPFIAEEAFAFTERCTSAALRVEQRSYAEDLPPSLDMHFDALRCFCTGISDADMEVDADGDAHCGFFRAWALAGQEL